MKIHVIVDALGNPVALSLTPGQASDLAQAEALFQEIDPQAFLDDKVYDADALIDHLKRMSHHSRDPAKSQSHYVHIDRRRILLRTPPH